MTTLTRLRRRAAAVTRFRPTARTALAAPGVLLLLGLFAGPLILLILYAFGTPDFTNVTVKFGWTLENIGRVFDGLYFDALTRSLLVALGATVGCFLLGLPVAYGISRMSGRTQLLLLIAVMVPFWTSFVVRTYSIVNLLGDRGPLADLLTKLGLVDGQIQLLYTTPGILIGMIYTYLPLMILPLFIAFTRADDTLRAAASDLGSTPSRFFFRVALPLARPGIVAGCLLVAIPSAGEFVVPAILGGEKSLMLGNVISSQFETVGDYPFGSALSVTLMVILTVFLVTARSRAMRGTGVA
ncbi:ABC transporter permease [Patulibacter defluvii]|uniref:ABC transporter permease n=1 Tax=Patulibacter defluvii TaxID=3095358 RepID=UPI002A763C74|nr:ABC transporter permease [Patulibacter sp. DM4]